MILKISNHEIRLTVAEDSTRVGQMKEKAGRGPNAHNKSKSELAAKVPASQIKEIFDYWKQAMGKPRSVLDSKRSRDIGWAIAVYGMDGAREAIDGCKASPFHMGENDRNTCYNDVTLIFRDAERVERFHEQLEKNTKKSAKEKWLES